MKQLQGTPSNIFHAVILVSVGRYLNISRMDQRLSLFNFRELKQATFLSTRTAAGSKLRRYRWRMMASAVLV